MSERIESHPSIMSGKPVVAGTRQGSMNLLAGGGLDRLRAPGHEVFDAAESVPADLDETPSSCFRTSITQVSHAQVHFILDVGMAPAAA